MQIEAEARLRDDAHARVVMLAHYLRILFRAAKVIGIIAIPVGIFAAGVAVGANFF